ncbi:cysteine dioxygenase [Pseudonocardiaceae bacterium YIM PH 21723]|nr:cysteine dioxygenase [Pseudonocardiaceae bacterium YIM PH 21723]
MHSGIDSPLFRELLHPQRPLWTPTQLRDLTDIVAQKLADPLLDILQFTEPQRWWAQLALTEGVELWLLSWTPGQGTKPHDHGGAAGAFTVLQGSVRESYRYPTGPIRTAHRRLGSGVGFGGGRAHLVQNLGTVNAATVHAYSPPLIPVREYADLTEVGASRA